MFTLTIPAAVQIQRAANVSGAMEMTLRIAARMEPDGSMQYGMGFDDPNEGDLKLDIEGVAVVIAPDSQDILDDTILDYVELNSGDFNFIFIDSRLPRGSPDTPSPGGCSGGGCSSGGCGKAGRSL